VNSTALSYNIGKSTLLLTFTYRTTTNGSVSTDRGVRENRSSNIHRDGLTTVLIVAMEEALASGAVGPKAEISHHAAIKTLAVTNVDWT
jgi:hypothetical protein